MRLGTASARSSSAARRAPSVFTGREVTGRSISVAFATCRVVTDAGFSRFRRVAETPFNIVDEAPS